MTKKDVHVVPHSDGWAVRTSGASRAGSVHETQRDAIAQARDQAIRNRSELVIHDQRGRIRDKDSFGNDPCPPRDQRR